MQVADDDDQLRRLRVTGFARDGRGGRADSREQVHSHRGSFICQRFGFGALAVEVSDDRAAQLIEFAHGQDHVALEMIAELAELESGAAQAAQVGRAGARW